MTGVSQSTATRQITPQLAALVLAFLRLEGRFTPEPLLPLGNSTEVPAAK
jgi:hypothetical protein